MWNPYDNREKLAEIQELPFRPSWLFYIILFYSTQLKLELKAKAIFCGSLNLDTTPCKAYPRIGKTLFRLKKKLHNDVSCGNLSMDVIPFISVCGDEFILKLKPLRQQDKNVIQKATFLLGSIDKNILSPYPPLAGGSAHGW